MSTSRYRSRRHPGPVEPVGPCTRSTCRAPLHGAEIGPAPASPGQGGGPARKAGGFAKSVSMLQWRISAQCLFSENLSVGGRIGAPFFAQKVGRGVQKGPRWARRAVGRGRGGASVSKNIRLQHEATFLRFRHVTSWPLFFHGEISRSTCLLRLPSYCCHCRLQTPLARLCPRVSPPAAQTCVPPALRN